VGQYWDVAGRKQIEKKLVDVRWKEVVRWFNEDVPAVIDAKSESRFQFADQIRGDVRIASGNQTTVDAGGIQLELQPLNTASNVRPCVIIYARKNMWGARNHAHAVGHRHASHLQ